MSILDTLQAALYGNPPSASFKPSRSGVFDAFGQLVQSLNTVVGGISGVTTATYAAVSTLNGHLEFADRTLGLVYNDPDPNKTGIYIKNGASGSGSWVFTGLLSRGPGPTNDQINVVLAPLFNARVAELNGIKTDTQAARDASQAFRDSAQVFRDLAQAWAESDGAPGGGVTKSAKGWAAAAQAIIANAIGPAVATAVSQASATATAQANRSQSEADRAAGRATAADNSAMTALAASRYFTSRANGEAGSTVGQAFSTDDGTGNLIIYKRTASGSDEIYRAVSPSGLARLRGHATRGSMKLAANLAVDGDDFTLTEAGRAGKFVWRVGDYTAEIAREAGFEGIYIAKQSDPTGATGALIRAFDGSRCGAWFGMLGNGSNNDLPAFNACMASFGPESVGEGQTSDDPTAYIGGEIILPRKVGHVFITDGCFMNGQMNLRKGVKISGEIEGAKPNTSPVKLIFPDMPIDAIVADTWQITHRNDAQFLQMENLQIIAQGHTQGGGCFRASVRVYLSHINIQGFGGLGVNLSGATGGYGNADASSLKHVKIRDCLLGGFKFRGNDCQVMEIFMCEVSNCGGWAYDDETAFGNLYTLCEAAMSTGSNNGVGTFRARALSSYFGNRYVMCYVEFGSAEQTDFDEFQVVEGGTLANVSPGACGHATRQAGYGPNVPTGGTHAFYRNGVKIVDIDTANIMRGLAGMFVAKGDGHVYLDEYQIAQKLPGASGAMQTYATSAGAAGSIVSTGNSTTFNTSSDPRLKKNVRPVEGAIDRIMALRAFDFEWISDGKSGRSFMSNDFQKIYPDGATGKPGEMIDTGILFKPEKIIVSDTEKPKDKLIPEGCEWREKDDGIGDLIRIRQDLRFGVTNPKEMPDGCEWEYTQTEPLYQSIDKTVVIPDLVAMVQMMKIKIEKLEAKK